MKKKPVKVPRFSGESDEADWWAGPEGREFVRAQASRARTAGEVVKGSRLVGKLNGGTSVQIALRVPEADLAKARALAARKGIGYQTLLKMLVHEGLQREVKRR
jgi:hypothetical protein